MMAPSKDLRKRVDEVIERAEAELLDASRQLASGINREAERFVPPVSNDIERLVDDVFDFAERVIKGQRRMVGDMVKAINEQADRAADAGREVTSRARKHAPGRRRVGARRAAAKKAATGTKAAAKKAPAKRAAKKATAGPRKAVAKKAPAKRAAKKATAGR